MKRFMKNRKILGWYFYDWATQPYPTLLLTFIFAPYFTSSVVGDPVLGQKLWAWMLVGTGLSLAIFSPLVGVISDRQAARRPLLLGFGAIYIISAVALWFAVPNADYVWLILCVLALGYLAGEFSFVIVNALMIDLETRANWGILSAKGWSFGYIGGLVALVCALLFFVDNGDGLTLLGQPPVWGLDGDLRQGTRIIAPLTALWFAVFAAPLFIWTLDGGGIKSPAQIPLRSAFPELWQTIKTLPQKPSMLAFLTSSLFYRDGLFALYGFGGIYASGVLGWDITKIGVFGIIGIIGAIFFTYLGGVWQKHKGTKSVLMQCVVLLIFMSLVMMATTRDSFVGIPLSESIITVIFMGLGAVLGGLGGILQATSRTMLVYQANPERIAEAFGLYAFSGRATAFLAPFLIAVATGISGSQRLGLLPVIVLFGAGLFVLRWVKEKS